MRGASRSSWSVAETGYVTLGLLISLTSLLELESQAISASITVNDTLHFGSGQCPRMPTARFRVVCAGPPVGIIACGCACRGGIYCGWAYSTSYLRGSHLDDQEVAYSLRVKT